jgi:hypothetical protein
MVWILVIPAGSRRTERLPAFFLISPMGINPTAAAYFQTFSISDFGLSQRLPRFRKCPENARKIQR